MGERNINLDLLNPVSFLGVNNQNIDFLSSFFPKLKIVTRGTNILIIGDEKEADIFEGIINSLIKHFDKEGMLTPEIIKNFLDSDNSFAENEAENCNDLILYGQNGAIIKAKTRNQKKLVDSFAVNDLVFAIGPAGTGKTYTAVALAVRALKKKEVKRIILTRPAVEAGENLGFLPGDLKEKLDPYMQPLYDALWDMIPAKKLSEYIEDRIIEIAPLAFMRGRTLDNAVVILDEAQNSTISQMKMFLTRLGRSAKFIITGDITQIDLLKNQTSGLIHAMNLLKHIEGIDFVFLDNSDIIRHKLVSRIINAYSNEK
jgi:phosphate starvation-inducible protein PhoH and related proteins